MPTFGGSTYGGSSYGGPSATPTSASGTRTRAGSVGSVVVLVVTAAGARKRGLSGVTITLFNDDGTHFSDWTPHANTTGTGNPTPGYYVPDFGFSSTLHYFARQVSAPPDKILFDFFVPSIASYWGILYFLFASDSLGQGTVVQLDLRVGGNGVAFNTSTAWNAVTSSVVGAAGPTRNAWHTAEIDLTPSTATLKIDGTGYGSVAYTSYGDYIGFVGNENGGSTYVFVDNISASRVVLPVDITFTAGGARTRSGLALPSISKVSSASSSVVRGGAAMAMPPIIGGGSGGGGTGLLRRWRFDDPVTHEFFEFMINPNDGGSPTRKRALTPQATSASDGTSLVFGGQEEVWSTELKGVVRDKVQLEALLHWYQKRYTVLLTDDLGRVQQIYIEQFSPKRAPLHHTPYRHTYTMRLRILGYGTAAIIADPGATAVMV